MQGNERIYASKKVGPLKRVKRDLAYLFFKFIYWLFNKFPLALSVILGKTLGYIAYLLFFRERNKGINQCVEILCLSKKEARKIVKRTFLNLGKNVVEAICAEKILKDPATTFEVEGEEVLLKLKEKGGVALTAHYGNWELLAAYFSRKYPVTVLARDLYDDRLNRMIEEVRRRRKIETIYRSSPNFFSKVKSALRGNSIIAVLLDTGFSGGKLLKGRLGNKIIHIPLSIIKILRRKEGIFTVFIIGGDKPHNYRVKIKSLNVSGNNEEELIQSYLNELKEVIINKPEEWIWWLRLY